ncbi:MAG: type IV toxin-antitoxin system AbiEi family antitoxin domain-containing protein [Candidatus Sumerlaeaceae bacterium]
MKKQARSKTSIIAPARIGTQRRTPHREELRRGAAKGELLHLDRGIYIPADYKPSKHLALAVVALKSPHAVLCLISALVYHRLTDQSPGDLYIALPQNTHSPRLKNVPIRVHRMTGAALTSGVEVHEIEGVKVKIFSPAKTVADCFKFRNKIGLDVALDALRNCWWQKRATMDELWHFAEICRVANVMRPYLESLV